MPLLERLRALSFSENQLLQKLLEQDFHVVGKSVEDEMSLTSLYTACLAYVLRSYSYNNRLCMMAKGPAWEQSSCSIGNPALLNHSVLGKKSQFADYYLVLNP